MTNADTVAIVEAVTAVTEVFFAIGGTILVVKASIFGFRRVMFLLTNDISYNDEAWENYSERKKHGG